MNDGYPLLLRLTGRSVVVVGGGRVATRRVPALLAGGARVRGIAPAGSPGLGSAAGVDVQPRRYARGDLTGVWLVLACTDDPEVNAQVTADAEAAGIFCVRADDAAASPAWVPAVAREAGLTVAVNAGGDPRRAAAVRDAIAATLRAATLPGTLAATPPAGDLGEPATATGSVALVGGGPGDPELITVRGRRLLAAADVVVVDALAPRPLLEDLPDTVEIVDAGKAPHRHNLTQTEINTLIVARARAGHRVVRLKGGDPFVFGRGGEEAIACAAAGVAFEVVPGVTSAVAVPAYAGIPVTHRGVSQGFAVVSAHLDPDHDGVDWDALARSPQTLVLLMAVGTLGLVAKRLVSAGRRPDTPVAICCDGTLPTERVVIADLATIEEVAEREGVGPPAVVVIGDVVSLRDRIAWR